MPAIAVDDLSRISDLPTLFGFLNSQLGWQVEPEDCFLNDLRVGPDSASVRAGQIPPFGGDDPFALVVAEFGDSFRRTALRETLRDIRRKMKEDGVLHGKSTEDLVFLCPCNGYEEVRFAHFEEREGRQPRLSVFGWNRRDVTATRTVREKNLARLAFPKERDLFGTDVAAWRAQWLEAWNVEAVTRDFFTKYRAVFEEVEELIGEVAGDKRLFTQRLFNRLLFIRFLEKKGWLWFGKRRDYLQALFDAAQVKGENFYSDRLFWLFFRGLGNPADVDDSRDEAFLKERRGDVPYLNGGLFETEDINDHHGRINIPNEAFALILNELFAPYNFTITESTPDDVEVAVDPEMLGKVFEELVTGRHESGSYYTPRPIVAFMCREALKGYLGGYERLVDFHDADGVSVPEAKTLLKKLADIKVVDPACGSGAYLLGMLQELFLLYRLLDTAAEQASAREDHDRKLDIIQNNLYGVDLDPFAVNVARLRLWLSLVVEFQGDDPPPLPNLDFKIEVGDSLTGPNPATAAASDAFRHQQIKDFEALKSQYARAVEPETKAALKGQIAESRRELAAWVHPGEASDGFDWRVEFAEVFESRAAHGRGTGGFDVVLANPPYVRQELIRDQKPALRRAFPDFFTGTADLYCYFYKRATELLGAGGTLVFISSNKWLRADYGGKLREHLAKTCRVRSITDFGELPVFSAAAFPMIFIAEREAVEKQAPLYTRVRSLEPPYPDVLALQGRDGQKLPADAIAGERWTLAALETIQMLRKMEAGTTPLGEYVKGQIYYGIKTGFNTAFVIDGAKRAELIAEDAASEEIIKPLAVGADIRRWQIRKRDRWLIYVPWHFPNHFDDAISGPSAAAEREFRRRYPAVYHHLLRYKKELSARNKAETGIRYEWYALQRWGAEYYDAFSKPKIVYPVIGLEPRFAWDTAGCFTNDKAFIIPTTGLFLLGVLNSAPVWQSLKATCAVIGDDDRRGRLELRATYIAKLPIPTVSASERAAIEALVEKCLDAKGEGCEEWEAEIDERVAALYGV